VPLRHCRSASRRHASLWRAFKHEDFHDSLPHCLITEAFHDRNGFQMPRGTLGSFLDCLLNISQTLAHAASIRSATLQIVSVTPPAIAGVMRRDLNQPKTLASGLKNTGPDAPSRRAGRILSNHEHDFGPPRGHSYERGAERAHRFHSRTSGRQRLDSSDAFGENGLFLYERSNSCRAG